MYTLLIVLAIVSSGLLVMVVLAQNSKGGGLSNQFGGSGASNLIGVKKTGDILEKLTWGFAIAIMLFSLGTHLTGPADNQPVDEVMEKMKEGPTNGIAPNLPKASKPAVKIDTTKK